MKNRKKWISMATALVLMLSVFCSQAFAYYDDIPVEYRKIHNSIGIFNTDTSKAYSIWELNDTTTLYVNHFSGNVTINTAIDGAYIGDDNISIVYNSLDEGSNELGNHFITSFNRKMQKLSDGSYEYKDVSGKRYHFYPVGTGNGDQVMYMDEMGRVLSFDSNGTPYFKMGVSSNETRFQENGLYLYTQIRTGSHGYTYGSIYNEDQLLDMIVRMTRSYNVSYNAYNRMTALTDTSDPTNVFHFTYDEKGRNLVNISDRNSLTLTQFGYDSNLKYVTQVNNARIIYDDAGRATEVAILDEQGQMKEKINYLYGNNQTILLKDGTMTLQQFNEDGTLAS